MVADAGHMAYKRGPASGANGAECEALRRPTAPNSQDPQGQPGQLPG